MRVTWEREDWFGFYGVATFADERYLFRVNKFSNSKFSHSKLKPLIRTLRPILMLVLHRAKFCSANQKTGKNVDEGSYIEQNNSAIFC